MPKLLDESAFLRAFLIANRAIVFFALSAFDCNFVKK